MRGNDNRRSNPLITTSALLNAAIDRANPLRAERGFGASLASFDAYRATYQQERPMVPRPEAAPADTGQEARLRQRYDALVVDRVAMVGYRTSKTFITAGMLLAVSVGLFVLHWRWMRRLSGSGPAAG